MLITMREIRAGEVPFDGGTAAAGGPRPAGLPRERPRRLRLRRLRERPRHGDASGADDEEGAGQLRAVLDRQCRGIDGYDGTLLIRSRAARAATRGCGGRRRPRRRRRPRSGRAAGDPSPAWRGRAAHRGRPRSRCTPPNPKPLAARPRSRPSVLEHQARHRLLVLLEVEPDARRQRGRARGPPAGTR